MIKNKFSVKNCLNIVFEVMLKRRATRQAGFNFLPPKPNTNYRKKAVSYRGTVTWNNFPNELKSTTSIQSFKNKIKKLYLFN